ncbi:MAG: dipeptidase [Flavobacteriales bacterium]|nr:dipeptidase [Flavobacteriales bacterium]
MDHTAQAEALAHKFIIADTHIDVPYRLREEWEDISKRTEKGDFDYERCVTGGLDVPFMSIYIPAELQETGGAKALADSLIDMVEGFQKDHPDKFKVVQSVSEVTENAGQGKVLLAMGMENGAGIEDKIENLTHFYQRGIRYITLTHSKSNLICDSSYDTIHQYSGLSPFGEKVVAEMNRLGIMVDISHVDDSTFWDVIHIAKAPPIASHSSCRSLVPGFERNMSDEMIAALAKAGGVVQINFGSSFITSDFNEAGKRVKEKVKAWAIANNKPEHCKETDELRKQFMEEEHVPLATLQQVVDHIDHVVKVAGIDHVGIGSDYDGVGPTLPTGLEDVSKYPNLIKELLDRGYSEDDIQKICSGNILRVWKAVEDYAASTAATAQNR